MILVHRSEDELEQLFCVDVCSEREAPVASNSTPNLLLMTVARRTIPEYKSCKYPDSRPTPGLDVKGKIIVAIKATISHKKIERDKLGSQRHSNRSELGPSPLRHKIRQEVK